MFNQENNQQNSGRQGFDSRGRGRRSRGRGSRRDQQDGGWWDQSKPSGGDQPQRQGRRGKPSRNRGDSSAWGQQTSGSGGGLGIFSMQGGGSQKTGSNHQNDPFGNPNKNESNNFQRQRRGRGRGNRERGRGRGRQPETQSSWNGASGGIQIGGSGNNTSTDNPWDRSSNSKNNSFNSGSSWDSNKNNDSKSSRSHSRGSREQRKERTSRNNPFGDSSSNNNLGVFAKPDNDWLNSDNRGRGRDTIRGRGRGRGRRGAFGGDRDAWNQDSSFQPRNEVSEARTDSK